MESLLPFVATALATLGVNAIIQFRIVPRVEARKRREARWESDVLALGEFLEFDLADALDDWMGAVYGLAFLQNPPEGTDPGRLQSAVEDNYRRLQETGDRLKRAAAKVDWLVLRVSVLEGFRMEAIRLQWDSMTAKSAIDQAVYDANDRDQQPLDPDQSLQLRRRLGEVLSPLKKYARAGIERPPPLAQTRLAFKFRRLRRLLWNGVVNATKLRPKRRSLREEDRI